MKQYEEVWVEVFIFPQEDILRTSVNGNDNQGAWNSDWDRGAPSGNE